MTRSVSYAPLLDLTLRHGYYDSGLAQPLQLAPTAATARVLARSGCRLRPQPGKTAIWYGTQNNGTPARDLDARTVFGFTFASSAPDFLTVTQPDWPQDGALRGDPVQGCLYFSNKGRTGATPVTLSSADGAVLPVQSRQFPVPRDKTALALTRWIDGTPVWQGPDPRTPGFIDLTSVLEDGRYVLTAEGTTLGDFYLTDQPAQGLLGAVEIGWTDDAFAPSPPLPRAVTIDFSARSGAWVYIIAATNPDMPLDQARIVDAAGTAAAFSAPQAAFMRGRPAWRFASTTPLTLAERYAPPRRLSLKVPPYGMRIPTPITLPMAAPTGAEAGPNGEATFVSYVTL